MLIGKQYADNKMYRGIKHYDGMPLTSEDIHEYSDTMHMKNAYIMNNLIGYGTLNEPEVFYSSDIEGIVSKDPFVIIIDGDISLIQSSSDRSLVDISELTMKGSGTVCALGVYEHLLATDTLYEYGGINNKVLPNDILNEKFKVQLSTRYQFRWCIVLVDTDDLKEDTIHVECNYRNKKGDLLDLSIDSIDKINDTFIFSSENAGIFDEDDVRSNIFLIPLADYIVENHNISKVECRRPINVGGTEFLTSQEEPVDEYPEGTVWYNPTTREFKTYVEGTGFVSSASKMGFVQNRHTHVIDQTITSVQDITIDIGISTFSEDDFLEVVYEGLVLTEDEHYTVDLVNNQVTLLGFTVNEGDTVRFTVTKIVEANDITNITSEFVTHMNTKSSKTIEGHVTLSDIVGDQNASDGVAVTPKALKDLKESLSKNVTESKVLVDSKTNKSYTLGVEDGMLYIEEV